MGSENRGIREIQQSLMWTYSLRDREEKEEKERARKWENELWMKQWASIHNCYENFQAPKFPLADCLENQRTSFLLSGCLFLWNFLTVPRLFLFLFCTAPFEMLPWICISRGPLLVMSTYCKLALIWMVLNCIHHSVSREYIKNVSDSNMYSNSRLYTHSMLIYTDHGIYPGVRQQLNTPVLFNYSSI